MLKQKKIPRLAGSGSVAGGSDVTSGGTGSGGVIPRLVFDVGAGSGSGVANSGGTGSAMSMHRAFYADLLGVGPVSFPSFSS